MSFSSVEALILDLDNTLICCSEVFHDCKARFSDFAAECIHGLTPEEALERYHAYDIVKLRRKDYRVERTAESMREILAVMAQEHGVSLASGAVAMADSIGRMIADHDYPPYPGVLGVLEKYKTCGMRMAVYTKGTDLEFQRRKVARFGIDNLVDIVEPTPSKTVEGYLDLARRLGVSPERCASVGDSEADDVEMGKRSGMLGVLVQRRVASASFDPLNKSDVTPDARIPVFADLASVIPYPRPVRRL